MLESQIRISLLPADKELLTQLGRRAREIANFMSPQELLTARYIENLLLRLVTPMLTDEVPKKAAQADTIYRLQREIGDAAAIVCPPEIKLRLLVYLLPLVQGDTTDVELLQRLLFPREIAIDE
ncbi:hypothetical protein LNN38_25615 [Pseudomonas sp. LA21]|uniref:hypothetical protein n=1 Tax=Pseudomonas sp. LA21 TaxID=2893373 RepID=UPI001FB5A89B|nr:hypothetical protein [Pseudomonas sp. LA21]MCJ1888257.1 hypothetical protein [Pseudomonas sp. LA21]